MQHIHSSEFNHRLSVWFVDLEMSFLEDDGGIQLLVFRAKLLSELRKYLL